MTNKNKNIYGIRKHKIGVASFLLGTLFIVGQAHDADASELSEAAQEQNVEKEKAVASEADSTSNAPQQEVASPTPVVKETDSATAPNTQEVKEAKVTVTTKAGQDVQPVAQPVSNIEKPVTQTAPVEQPSAANAKNVTAPINMEEVNVEKGQDVTNKVTVNKSSITAHQNNSQTHKNSNTVNPHNAERVTLNYDWSFGKGIKNDDYFEFQLSDNVNTNGISTVKKVPNIIDTSNSDKVIAFGEIKDQNRVRYRFTDYVNEKENVKGKLSLNLFIDPAKVTDEGEIKISSKLGEKETSQNFNIKYIDGVTNYEGITLNGHLDQLSKADQSFTHYATFKPNKNKLTNVKLTGTVTNGTLQSEHKGELKVYEYLGNGELSKSGYTDVSQINLFKDITNNLKSVNSNSTGYEITFDSMNQKPYVIVYKGHYKKDSEDFNFMTKVLDYQNTNQSQNSYYWPYFNSFNLIWNNGVVFYSNNASGEGKDKPILPTYGFSELVDTSQNSAPDTMIFQQTGVLEEIEDSVVLTTLAESGEDRGENTTPVIETTEDTHPVDFEETTTYPPSNHAHEMIEFEEETNHGEQDTVHHSDVVEYDEDTTTGLLTGAISDHTTTEDTMEYTTDGLLIEFDDEMNPNVSGQYGDVTMETVDESSQVDTLTGLETLSGEYDGTMQFEEDTINQQPPSDKGHRVPPVIDLTTPNTNDKFNIQPIAPNTDATATYQIGDFVWRDEDHNGVQNDGERGLEGVFVTLKTPEGKILRITTTDETGHYRFSNVEKGKYVVEFKTPEGYEATSQHTTADTSKDSDGLIANIDVTQDDMTIDAGFFPLENWNPKQEEETYTIGDFVWRDEDYNGVQNEGERGLEGVLVTLKTPEGAVVSTTTSDANGHYHFTNVQKGKYIVEFTTPEGYEATSKHTTANTAKDSDGLIANIDVTQDDMTIDAGFFPLENWNPKQEEETYTIGDFVWRDEDHNGVQNDGERGLEGVLVTLKTPEGTVVATTTSDANGHYHFTNVQKGKYIVEFTTPEGYEATSKHTTANTAKDSDGLIANIEVTQDDMTIDAGFFPLENWNPQPEPKKPEENEQPEPKQPDTPQPKLMNPGENEMPEPNHPDVPQPKPMNPGENEMPEPNHPDVPQPEPMNPGEKEMPEPNHPDVPQPEPMNPGEKEMPEPKQPDTPQPEPMNPGEKEKPEPKQPDTPQQPGMNEQTEPTMMPEHEPMKEAQNKMTQSPKSSSQTNEALPETGESTSQQSALLFGGLLSLLGFSLLRRQSKQKRS